jgi:hypothetical protein
MLIEPKSFPLAHPFRARPSSQISLVAADLVGPVASNSLRNLHLASPSTAGRTFLIFHRSAVSILAAFIRKQSPCRQVRQLLWAAYSHSTHPHLAEAVEVTSQSKTGAGPLDRLSFCTCHVILVVTSFFPVAAVRTDAGNRHDEHLAALDCFVFLHADDRRHRVDRVLPCPTPRRDHLVEAVGIGSWVRIRSDAGLSVAS